MLLIRRSSLRCVSLILFAVVATGVAEERWPHATAAPKLDVVEFERHVIEWKTPSTKLWGSEIAFDARVEQVEGDLLVKMEGLKSPVSEHLGRARVVNPQPDHRFNVGDRLRVRGLILQEDYSVWSIWTYEMQRLPDERANEAEEVAKNKGVADPFVGPYQAAGALGGRTGNFRVEKDGEFYRLVSEADERRYAHVRFIRKADRQLIDEDGSLGTVTAGDVMFGDGRRAKSSILRIDFCYESYLLIDTRAAGMFP